MDENKLSPTKLIKDFFGTSVPREIMALTTEDRVQLGSAIAAQQGIARELLAFEPVSY